MGCCPTTYWCVDGSPVGVEADGEGVYTPPDGATGGPFATFAEALTGCVPADPWRVACDPDDPDAGALLVPRLLTLNFTDRTGMLAAIFPNSATVPVPAPSYTDLGGGIEQVLFGITLLVFDPTPTPYHPYFQFGVSVRMLRFAAGGCSAVDVALTHLCNCDGPDIVANLTARYGCNCQGHASNPVSPWALEPVGENMLQKAVTLSGDTWAWGTAEEACSDATGWFNACITGTMRIILSR